MKKFKGLFGAIAVLVWVYFQFIYEPYGTMLEFNATQVYYTSNVTENEATKLGEFLIREEFADGVEKTIQLDKENDIYQFRMVAIDTVINNEEWTPVFKSFLSDIKIDLFSDSNVELHLCDDNLETVQVVKFEAN